MKNIWKFSIEGKKYFLRLKFYLKSVENCKSDPTMNDLINFFVYLTPIEIYLKNCGKFAEIMNKLLLSFNNLLKI